MTVSCKEECSQYWDKGYLWVYEMAKEDLGINITEMDKATGCLIWLNGVILADTDEKRFDRMLDIIYMTVIQV